MPSFVIRPPIRKRGQNWFPLSRSSTRAQITGSGGITLGGSALVTFEVPSAPSNIKVLWDFDNDGDFSESIEDITELVLSLETIAGRDFPSQITSKAGPGQLRMTLRNDDDRFNFFNTDSPLSQNGNTLRVGRKLRVRDADTADPEPTLLAKDTFDRANFAPADEIGHTWTQPLGGWSTEATTDDGVGGAQPNLNNGNPNIAVVDVGVTDYYAQVKLSSVSRITTGLADFQAGLIYRYQDTSNYSLMVMDSDTIAGGGFVDINLVNVVAGVSSVVDSFTSSIYDDLTIGVLVQGTQATGYRDGVTILSGTAIQTDETEVGLYAEWPSAHTRPTFDDFYVWTGFVSETEGIIWTGDVVSVSTSVLPGPQKLCTVEGRGWLGRMADAIVPAPYSPATRDGGSIIGQMAAYTGILNPGSGSIERGPNLAGPIPMGSDGNALDFARAYEELEMGCMHETNEGPIIFETHSTRMARTSDVTFSDAAGAQFGYSRLDPLDNQREIINRVVSGIVSTHARVVLEQTQSATTAQTVQNPVTIEIPGSVENHDLVLIFIASTVRHRTEEWITPLWWEPMRDLKDSTGLRVYSHITQGDDGGEDVTFYEDLAEEGGNWIAKVFVIRDWYGSHEGLQIVPPVKGSDAPVILPSWGANANTFFTARFGARGNPNGSVSGSETYPIGYPTGDTQFENGITDGFDDVAIQTAYKNDVNSVEDPGGFTGYSLFQIIESVTVAVRGFNGNPPPESGIRTIEANDIESQQEHNAIKSHETAAFGFSFEDDANDYNEHVLENYADDHPVFSMSFFPSKGAHYRTSAVRKRLGEKITLVADNNTGMGVNGDFFIEAINHRWSNGTTLWETTWELSPVVEEDA